MSDHTALTTSLISAIAHSTLPMVLSDPNQPDCPMIAANQAFQDLTGYSRDEIIGHNCRFLQGDDTDPATKQRIHDSLAAGEGCIEWILNHRKDGSIFYNMLFVSPVYDEAGQLVYFFGNQRDTAVGLPEWVKEVQLGSAQMSGRVETEFHRLLTSILADTHLAETELGAEKARALERLIENARKIGEVTTRLEVSG